MSAAGAADATGCKCGWRWQGAEPLRRTPPRPPPARRAPPRPLPGRGTSTSAAAISACCELSACICSRCAPSPSSCRTWGPPPGCSGEGTLSYAGGTARGSAAWDDRRKLRTGCHGGLGRRCSGARPAPGPAKALDRLGGRRELAILDEDLDRRGLLAERVNKVLGHRRVHIAMHGNGLTHAEQRVRGSATGGRGHRVTIASHWLGDEDQSKTVKERPVWGHPLPLSRH